MTPPASSSAFFLLLLLLLLLLLPPAQPAVFFSYPRFSSSSNDDNITLVGVSAVAAGALDLTPNQSGSNSVGWAVYSHPVHLWDAATGNLTSFATNFSFTIQPVPGDKNALGDGLAFFLASNGSDIPENSYGGTLGLFVSNSSSLGYIPTVAVEFDTFSNTRYSDPPVVHAGIDVGNPKSVAYTNWTGFNVTTGESADARVAYDATSTNLSVVFFDGHGTRRELSYVVNLGRILPPWVSVGFSAATGASSGIHKIHSWSFWSSLEDPPQQQKKNKKSKINAGVIAGVLSGGAGAALVAGSGVAWFIIVRARRRRRRRGGGGGGRGGGEEEEEGIDEAIAFDGGRGPKRFRYGELARATRNFAAEQKLGKGGFGDVYRGVLLHHLQQQDHHRPTTTNLTAEVAVKRVARGSRQGIKEYISEVKIISRLRHRNLVQLVGWCHDKGELLLVYEYMPNGSLDAHLFGRNKEAAAAAAPLSWPTRYNIARGLAAALLYLHEGWEQCVVHRDVKSSNVMLDADFNAKLGDFGLARLVDHGRTMQTTALAGTMGYLAPECATAGKASKESDVYSFGVVALEIACGRRPIEPRAAEEGQVSLVGWVWDLYGRRAVVEAADERLSSDFDEGQMERLMSVGLWCAHPDFRQRPSMRQVVSALNFETPPPDLPAQMPVATYTAPMGNDVANPWQSSSTGSSSAAADDTSILLTGR